MQMSVYVKLALSLALLGSTAVGQDQKLCLSLTTVQYIFDELTALSLACGKPAWPPAAPTYHIVAATHQVSLALRPVVLPDSKWTNWEQSELEVLTQKYRGPPPTGSWLSRVITMQRSLGSQVTGKTEYDYYPPMVDVKSLVGMQESGKPLPLAPVDDPNLQIVRFPHTCSRKDSSQYDLIIVVYSCVKCTEARSLARKTFLKDALWKPLNIGYFFVMGMPAEVNQRIYDFSGTRIRQEASYSEGVSRDEAAKALLIEADQHKDILVGDYMDEFFNSTLRAIVAFRWASLFCTQRTSLFLFVDPHYTVVPQQVKNFVGQIPKASRPDYYGGQVFYGNPILRTPEGTITDNPWAVSPDELPWTTYPWYASRVALLVGSQAVGDATLAMMYTRRFRIADVYIGIVFHRIQRKPQNIPQFIFYADQQSAKSAFGAFTSTIVQHLNWDTEMAR